MYLLCIVLPVPFCDFSMNIIAGTRPVEYLLNAGAEQNGRRVDL